MAIPVADADAYLKRLLTEDDDADETAAFPQSGRYRVLQEAVIAIMRMRPDQFSDRVELPYDSVTDAYVLPTTHEYLLEVIGLNIAGKIHVLQPSTTSERNNDSPCWREDRTTESMPNYFVWSRTSPRHVYIDGYKPASSLVVIASTLNGFSVNGSATVIPLPYSFFPELIDYALSRCFAREDTSGGDAAYYLTRHRGLMEDRMNSDSLSNPIIAAIVKSIPR